MIKAAPILLAVYALLYWIENKLRSTPALLERAAEFGPVVGAIAGLIPQCGFSAAASALFLDGFLAPATLVAVFLATSDEAIPVLLADGALAETGLLLVSKFVLAVAGGYALKLLMLRKKGANQNYEIELEMEGCGCGCSGPFEGIVLRTLRILVILLLFCAATDLAIELIGTERMSALLLNGSLLQPIICACVGLIPSCAVSVLLAELYLSGAIGFGGLIAGLSTGAGFGYMVLFSSEEGRKRALPFVGATWVFAAIGGIICQLLFG
ncbi:MAG: arsenic efflux protein [Butyricicoccus sp.]